MNRQVVVLASAQALIQTAAVLIMTIGGLVGLQLAPSKTLATAPIAAMFLGTALTMLPASIWMAKVGRKKGFTTGAVVGLIGALLATSGIFYASFWVLCVGILLIGIYQGFAQFYRFAAVESVALHEKTKAISLVLAGGVVAALFGPWLARGGKDFFETPYLGSFGFVIVAGIAAVIVLQRLQIKPADVVCKVTEPARPLLAVVTQPTYIIALFAAASGYGLMTLAMTATPLAMSKHDHMLPAISTVIQMHVLAMYLPSFVTGRLIDRFGSIPIMLTGALSFACHFAVVNLGSEMHIFAISLAFVGVGWNFLYIGGTSLVSQCISDSERGLALGLNDTVIFATSLAGAFSAGSLVNAYGWMGLNSMLIPWVTSVAIALLWLALKRKRPAKSPSELPQ